MAHLPPTLASLDADILANVVRWLDSALARLQGKPSQAREHRGLEVREVRNASISLRPRGIYASKIKNPLRRPQRKGFASTKRAVKLRQRHVRNAPSS